MRGFPWIAFFILCSIPDSSLGGKMRVAYANSRKMSPVYLSMGQSTVLRFNHKPKKIVIGNQNYYSVEFIDNDVAIQPLGKVGTNLFVYTPFRVYGFLLKVIGGSGYDDVVEVKWRNPKISFRKKQPKKRNRIRTHKIERTVPFKDLKVHIKSISFLENRNLHIIDIALENKGEKPYPTKGVSFTLTRGGKPLRSPTVIFKTSKVPPSQTSQGRIFISLEKKRGFSLHIKSQEKKKKIIISKRIL